MKLRTKLVLVFFVLAIVPMVAIVTANYLTAQRAFRQAMEQESFAQAERMNDRLATLRDGLDQRFMTASRARLQYLTQLESTPQILPFDRSQPKRLKVPSPEIAELAPWFESYEFVPSTPVEPPQQGELQGDGPARLFVEDDGTVVMVLEEPERAECPDEETEDLISTRVEAGLEMIGGVLEKLVVEGEKIAGRTIDDLGSLEQEERKELQREAERLSRELRRTIPESMRITREKIEALREARKKSERVLGHRFQYEVHDGDHVVGHLHAKIRTQEVLESVFASARRDEGEVPFAIDAAGELHTANQDDSDVLQKVVSLEDGKLEAKPESEDWVMAVTTDPKSEMRFGIARPVGEGLREIRKTLLGNLSFGLALVALAGFVFLPLTSRMTRNLEKLTEATRELAAGRLQEPVRVSGRDEIAVLGETFNQMASDLDQQQQRLVEEEKIRRESELENRLLEEENLRRGNELEQARQFQLSLLPQSLPEHSDYEVAASMRTATEVGGDYYDCRVLPDDSLALVIGDATGHGAAAATMVTIAKSLFTSWRGGDPAAFLDQAAEAIRAIGLERMCMALTVARISDAGLQLAAAGMPPALIHRSQTGECEELLVPGMPLGSVREPVYRQVETALDDGDSMLLLSDGFPELINAEGEPLGYDRAQRAFENAVPDAPDQIIASLDRAADLWRGEISLKDDVTYLVVQRRRA